MLQPCKYKSGAGSLQMQLGGAFSLLQNMGKAGQVSPQHTRYVDLTSSLKIKYMLHHGIKLQGVMHVADVSSVSTDRLYWHVLVAVEHQKLQTIHARHLSVVVQI